MLVELAHSSLTPIRLSKQFHRTFAGSSGLLFSFPTLNVCFTASASFWIYLQKACKLALVLCMHPLRLTFRSSPRWICSRNMACLVNFVNASTLSCYLCRFAVFGLKTVLHSFQRPQAQCLTGYMTEASRIRFGSFGSCRIFSRAVGSKCYAQPSWELRSDVLTESGNVGELTTLRFTGLEAQSNGSGGVLQRVEHSGVKMLWSAAFGWRTCCASQHPEGPTDSSSPKLLH